MQAGSQAERVGSADKQERSESARRCLLIVEDDPAVYGLLTALAQEPGYEVLHSADGPTALQFALSSQPAAIILDLGLPDIDGQSLLTGFKANPATAQIPVIVISGMTHVLTPEDRALTAAILAKPFRTEELLAAIRQALAPTSNETGSQPPRPKKHFLARLLRRWKSDREGR